jgi:hypothetical protein
MIQPTPITGVLPNGVYYATSTGNRFLALDFTYRPVEGGANYIVARVHLTPEMAKYVRDAVEEFLKKIPEKK